MTHPDIEGIDTFGHVHQQNIVHLMNLMLKLHVMKSKTYGGSWIKRGFVGAFHTFARPWDRIDNMINERMNIVSLTFFAACVDLSLYLLKMAAIIIQKDESILIAWINEEGLKEESQDSQMKETLESYATNQLVKALDKYPRNVDGE